MARGKDGKRPGRSAREVMDRKRPTEHVIQIALESEYADTLAAAEKVLADLERDKRLGRLSDDEFQARGRKAQEAIEAARAEYDENSVTFRAKALGRRKLDEVMKEHEPTEEQKQAFQELVDRAPLSARNGELPYNTETLPPALLHLALVEPVFTLDEAQEMWNSDDWSDAELTAILNACWAVNKMIK